MSRRNYSDEFDVLFELLGNRTRYEILRRLATEPMFLGQISRELEVGQQAILRHLRQLIEQGLLETYEDESIRGPPRKYYRLSKTVRLTVHIAPDGIRVIRITPSGPKPQTMEEVLRRSYPDVTRLLYQTQRLPEIANPLNRKQLAIDLIQQLEQKVDEFQDITKYLQNVIKRVRNEYL